MYCIYLLIDHGNRLLFRGMRLIYYRVPLNHAYCCRISGCEQPSSMSQIITNLDNWLILFYTTRGSEPPSGKVKYLYILSSWPKEPNLWPHVLGSEGHGSRVICRLMSSMHRTAVVALHSMGYSHLFPFSCLVVDKLLLVLPLLQCKVPPMGTPICHEHLAWVVRLDLPPRTILDELDYYGSFVDFADIAWLCWVLRLLLRWVHRHHPEALLWKLSHHKPRFSGLHGLPLLEARLLRRGPERKVFLK
jgi:hypothetical protein